MTRTMALTLAAIALAGCAPTQRVAPAPAPDIDCLSGPFMAFFDRNSAALDAGSIEILTHARLFLTEPCWKDAGLVITGYREGDETAAISRARAAAARDYFMKHGVSTGRVRIADAGSSQPRMV